MASLAVDAAASLHEMLRRRPTTTDPASFASATLATCLETSIPVYSFLPRQLVAPASKLPRVDSIPAVPDFFAEPRCESPVPAGALPIFCPIDSVSSFNSLPLDIDAGVPMLDASRGVAGPVAKALPYATSEPCLHGASVLPQQHVKPLAAGRHLPRRHASDIARPGGSSRRGSLDLGSGGGASDGGLAVVPNCSLLETVLMTLWDDRADRGLFRYDVTQCPTRVLPGRLGFVTQLNEGRATKKRPTEFSADRVVQPFDPAKFNFKKAAMAEALLAFQPAPAAVAGGGGAAESRLLAPSAPLSATTCSPHLVVINVSPIDYGHVLLLPHVLDQLPQALDGGSVLLALQFARELRSPAFRVGYNSLGAFGTINHLHFHTYYMPLSMPCERAGTAPLPGRLAAPPVPDRCVPAVSAASPDLPAAGFGQRKRRFGDSLLPATAAAAGDAEVRVSRLVDYPVNGFVVEPAPGLLDPDGAGLEAVAAVVGVAAERMQAANQPFNLLVSDAGRRVFVFPQCYAERQAAGAVPAELLDTGVNPASFEVGGHLVLKRGQDFQTADEAWACRLLAAVSLDEESFMSVASMCFGDGC